MDYGGFPPNGNGQGSGRRQLSLAGGGGGPPDDPHDDEDEDDDDEGDEEDEEEEEEEGDRARRRRRKSRDSREVKNDRPRISRKEAERVSIPAWPKIHQLDTWKMQLLMNVLSACADPDTDAWTRWLEQALGLNPDLDLLSDSGGDRFATIDIKMAMGMQNMLKQAPDEAKDVYLDATRHSELRHQQGVIVKGRELVALVMQSFRTSDRTDLVYHIEHLFNLDFPGDKNLVMFRNKWYDLLLKMRNEDRPSKLALRDILYRKIKGSKKMEFGLNAYHRLPDKHPQKTYEFLLALIDYQIKADREDLMLDMKEKSVKSRSPSPKRDDGACFAFQKGKCDKGSACKYRHELIKNNSAPATSSDKAQAKSKATAKAAAPAVARKAIAMPAIVLKQSAPAGKVSFKKDVDQVEPDEAETVYHEHDDDAMSESSRWSGESEIPEKMVWFKEVLDVDENGEIIYLEDERRQWERKGEWYGYEDNENEPYQYVYVDEKKFKSSDHRELSAYQVQRSLIRAKILREVVDDIYKRHYFPVTKESSIMFEYDRNKDEIKESAVDWKKQHGMPKNVFAMSTCISKRVKWLMDTGCGHDLIGRAKAKSLGVEIEKDDDEIVFQTANGSTSTSDVAKIVVDELDETVEPHVLDETPTVLSVGRRCMKMGYAFHWMPGKLPFMVTPKQGFVHLQVKDDIPYPVSDGKLRSNRHRPTIDDLKEHFSEVLAMVTNDEADQGGDDENDVTPAAVGESAEAEGEHHDEAFDFGPPGGAGPVRPPPVAEEVPVDVGSVPHRHGDAEAHEEEVDEDDPDAGIEVDVYEGSSIKRKVGVLKKDANSIAHLLTHRYRNPFCESCVKAKMRHFRSRTGAFKREVKTFGDLVTFDFVTASGDHEVEGRYALIIRDIYTGIIMAYPTARRDTDSVVRAIKHFCGRRKIKQVYSDDGPELINACVELKLNHDLSLPGRPQNNSLAERTNQFIIDQTSACLVHAGLPTCYWVQAITTLCHLMNIEEVNGSSAWMRLHGEEFKGEKIPFGALVDFKPSEARGGKREKFEPRGETGIFAGYVLSTGMHWANKYRAWALTAFAGAELNIKKAKVPPRLRMPHQTERMILKSPLTFPIQQKYKVANETLEGIEMSIDAIGLDARDRLIEDEDYEPELLQSDEKRLLDDEVDQIAGLLLDDGPEVIIGDQGDHAGDEDARPSSSIGKGDRSPTFHTCQLGYPGMVSHTSTTMARRSRSTRPGDRILSGRTDSG